MRLSVGHFVKSYLKLVEYSLWTWVDPCAVCNLWKPVAAGVRRWPVVGLFRLSTFGQFLRCGLQTARAIRGEL